MNGRKTTKPPSGGLSLNDRFASLTLQPLDNPFGTRLSPMS
jgi:hypothetical protein